MVEYTHAVFVDESGNGAPVAHINRYWCTAAVAVPFSRFDVMADATQEVLDACFHPRCDELKGSSIPDQLVPSTDIPSFGKRFGQLLGKVNPEIWVAVSKHGVNTPPGVPPSAEVKQTVRHLVMERFNGWLGQRWSGDGQWVLVWDLSDNQEFRDLSDAMSNFRNAFTDSPLDEQLDRAPLAGLSDDWPGLQVADIVANFGLHYYGDQLSQKGAHPKKAEVFDRIFWDHLSASPRWGTEGYGWKTW